VSERGRAAVRPVDAPRVAILTLGCKLNLADSETMARRMRDGGWSVVDRAAGADAVVVNTCSVTHVADAKSRHLVRQARRLAPGAQVAITGCMLETAKQDVIDALSADLVYHQPRQGDLTSRLIERRPAATPTPCPSPIKGRGSGDEVALTMAPDPRQRRPAERWSQPVQHGRPFRTRAFVSAQEGCNDVCAFCIVPRTRGRERSKDVATVVAEVRAREAEGVHEVVITGTQLGAWQTSPPSPLSLRGESATARRRGGVKEGEPERGLYALLEALLRETSVPRIRMSSVQPQDLSLEMIRLWQDPRLCRHFHLALQSGSPGVLGRMRRRYGAQQYREAVDLLRREVPWVAITTDVIAGFPGETETEFEETLAFCREMAFAGMHVFPYSQRLGTVAARMPEQVSEPSRKDRVRQLIRLAEEMSAAYRESFVGSRQTVLWESAREHEGGRAWEGLTDTYVRVFAVSDAEVENRMTPVTVTEVCEGGVRGKL